MTTLPKSIPELEDQETVIPPRLAPPPERKFQADFERVDSRYGGGRVRKSWEGAGVGFDRRGRPHKQRRRERGKQEDRFPAWLPQHLQSIAFEQGKDDFIENIDDVCIHYDGGRVAANESLIAEITGCGLRKTTKETGLDRKTIRAILSGNKVKASTLANVVWGLRQE